MPDHTRRPAEGMARRSLTRRQLLRTCAAGIGFGSASLVLSACGAAGALPAPATSVPAQLSAGRPLTPTFYQWIVDFHPGIAAVNAGLPNVNMQIAPVQGFGIERFVAEAKSGQSTWDMYVGMTPFVEMRQLIAADVIEPWDDYIPAEVRDDLLPAIREECSVDGKLYSWPFVLDVTGMAAHRGLAERAAVAARPTTWEDYLAGARQAKEAGAAYGATFDARGWRSLVPFAHSLSTDAYTSEGLFDFTGEPAVAALRLMKEIMALSQPDILNEGASDGGVANTPDEAAFAAGKVAYYTKYFNAPLRFAQAGGFANELELAALPRFSGGGGTVFWTTGACLFKYGANKERAAEYLRALTYNEQIWRDSIAGTPAAHPGQLPPYASLYAQWERQPPSWMQPFVPLIREQLSAARAIPSHLFGLQQFVIGKPFWEEYLTGKEPDPGRALGRARDAVAAAMRKGS